MTFKVSLLPRNILCEYINIYENKAIKISQLALISTFEKEGKVVLLDIFVKFYI